MKHSVKYKAIRDGQAETPEGSALAVLRRIGLSLGSEKYPRVLRGGTLVLGEPDPYISTPGEEYKNEGRSHQGGSSARSRAGSTKRQGTARGSTAQGSGETHSSASVFSQQRLRDACGVEVEGVGRAYPQAREWLTPDAAWLAIPVEPVRNVGAAALLVTAYPFSTALPVQSWAWWKTGIWIGPRHTNYPNGSICAFEVKDGTWRRSHPLEVLIDLQVLWIARHAHLLCFGSWPGRQVLHTPYERLAEHQPVETCGGCRSGLPYNVCCFRSDKMIPLVSRTVEFYGRYRTFNRRPPKPLIDFVSCHRDGPPTLAEVGTQPPSR